MDEMKKAKLRRVHIKGYFTPGIVLFIRGFLDSKFIMLDVQRKEKKYSSIKSPYLMALKYNLSAYDSKLEMRASYLCEGLNNEYTEICSKLSLLQEDIGVLQDCRKEMDKMAEQGGNEKRTMKRMDSESKTLLENINQLRIKKEELRHRIEDLAEYKKYCREKMHSVAKSKAYSYYDGCVKECYGESYLCDEDFETQLF